MINNDKIFSCESFTIEEKLKRLAERRYDPETGTTGDPELDKYLDNEQSQEGIIGESLNTIKLYIIGCLLVDAILVFVAFILNKLNKAKDKKLKEKIKNNKPLMDKISNFFKTTYTDYCKYLETTKKIILEEINKSPKSIIDDVEFGELDRIFKPVSVKEYIKYCSDSFHKISKHPKNKSVIIDLTVNEGYFLFANNQEVTDEYWKLVKSINSSITNIKFDENPLIINEIEEDDGGFGFPMLQQEITLSDEIINNIKELMGK